MKKSQFFILFALVFSFFTVYFYYYEYKKENLKEIFYLNEYFKNEISFLTTLNCSYNYKTIFEFINITGIEVEVFQYIDNCDFNLYIFDDYYNEKISAKNLSDYYLVCYSNLCKKVPKIGKHFCLVYEIKSKRFFECF